MREREGYRHKIEHISAYFGGNRNRLTAKDVAQYCGRDVRTVKRWYNIPRDGIDITDLAEAMCKKRDTDARMRGKK